jgi:hypothetical protein
MRPLLDVLCSPCVPWFTIYLSVSRLRISNELRITTSPFERLRPCQTGRDVQRPATRHPSPATGVTSPAVPSPATHHPPPPGGPWRYMSGGAHPTRGEVLLWHMPMAAECRGGVAVVEAHGANASEQTRDLREWE